MNVAIKIQELKKRAGNQLETRVKSGPKRPPLPVESAYDLNALTEPKAVTSERPAKIASDLGRKILDKLQATRESSDPFSKRLQRLN